MEFRISRKGTTLIVSFIGELDHHCADGIRQRVDGEITKSSTRNAIFDFSRLSFMDSSGIGIIMGRYKNLQQLNGKIAVVNANPQVKRILDMSGLLKLVPVYDNIETAINNM